MGFIGEQPSPPDLSVGFRVDSLLGGGDFTFGMHGLRFRPCESREAWGSIFDKLFCNF